MTTLTVSDMVAFVRAQIDEVQNTSDAAFINGDNLSLKRIVESVASAVVRSVHLSAPNVLLEGVAARTGTTPGTGGDVVVAGVKTIMKSITVPNDFLRLVSLKMSDWAFPVITLVSEDSVEYSRQKNRYLRGTPTRPVAAIVHKTTGGYDIEVYSTTPGSTLQEFLYVPEITLSAGGVTICRRLRDACLYAVAAEVMRCIGQSQRAAELDSLSAQSMNPVTDMERMSPANGEKVLNTR